MTDFNTQKHEVLKISFNNIVKLIKDTLKESDRSSFIRILKNGTIKIISFGEPDVEIFSFERDEFLSERFYTFAPYIFQVLAITSEATFDESANQKWNIMVDDTLLKFQSNSKSKSIDAMLVI